MKILFYSHAYAPSVGGIGRVIGTNLADPNNLHRILVTPSVWNEPAAIIALTGVFFCWAMQLQAMAHLGRLHAGTIAERYLQVTDDARRRNA